MFVPGIEKRGNEGVYIVAESGSNRFIFLLGVARPVTNRLGVGKGL